MKRILALIPVGAAALTVACSDPITKTAERPARDATAERGTLSSRSDGDAARAARKEAGATSVTPSSAYADKAEPEKGSKCAFEERAPAQRPKHYVPANRDSNIIFYQQPKGPLWSDTDPDRALAELRKGDLIVAARAGKKDLWIRPKSDLVTLEVGKYRLSCY